MKRATPPKDEAIRLIMQDPNLLKRPIVIVGNRKIFGFDAAAVGDLL